MTDDWNLKGKDFLVDCDAEKPDGTPIKTYYDNDIETLRQKLIADIENLESRDTNENHICINKDYEHGFDSAKYIIQILIDKRFGVIKE